MENDLTPRLEIDGISLDNKERITQIIEEYNKSKKHSKTYNNILGILFLLMFFFIGVTVGSMLLFWWL